MDDNKNATGMYGIIKDISQQKMLEYSLFENDNYEHSLSDCVTLVPAPFNFAMMLDDIRSLITPFTAKKGIALTIEQPELIIPMLDEAHLKQVILTLTDNAVKFTSEGEVKISVTTSLQPESSIGELTISISDTGNGVDPEKIDELFDLKKPSKTQEEQHISLIFAQQTIIAMSGKITLDSTPDKGSVFAIHIPHVNFIQPLGKIAKNTKTNSVYFEPAMVLTTGNPKYIQNMLSFVLLRVGLCPVPVDSPQEALEKMQQPGNNIALAIIDTRMQDINPNIIKKLARCGKTSHIPMIATIITDDDTDAFSDDFDATLTLPVGTTQLSNVLQKYLPSQIF
jgi:CheY-like chemotaxis protein/anti-sigma regulatory factor (Ser/Thr protein kinase)